MSPLSKDEAGCKVARNNRMKPHPHLTPFELLEVYFDCIFFEFTSNFKDDFVF